MFLAFVCISVSGANQTWQKLKPYVLKSKMVFSFDNSVFDHEKGFYLTGEKLRLNAEDTIPYRVYENFFENFKSNSKIYIENCNEHVPLNILDLPNAGRKESDRWFVRPYYLPIAYRVVNSHIYEFILFAVVDRGTMISILCYDESKNNLMSDCLLFFGQRIEIDDWNMLNDYNKFSTDYDCSTLNVMNDVFIQNYSESCGLGDDEPCLSVSVFRMVKYNEILGCYEIVWSDSNLYLESRTDSVLIQQAMAYRCLIKDNDGYTNVREKPNGSSKIIYKINDGEQFVISNKMCGDWYRIICYGKHYNGWIHKSRVEIREKAGEYLQNSYRLEEFNKYGEFYWKQLDYDD